MKFHYERILIMKDIVANYSILDVKGSWLRLRILSACGKITTRKTPNTDTFCAVIGSLFNNFDATISTN